MTPIALFIFNRPSHTLRTLEALALNKGAIDMPLYVFSDGARSSDESQKVEQARQICKGAKGFASVTVVERDTNYGLARNIIEGVTELMEKYGRVIVLEDDLLTSPGFLSYMTRALDFYDGKPVWSICGYTPPISIRPEYCCSTFMARRNGSWGWATWKRQWTSVDWQLNGFDEFVKNKQALDRFAGAGNDLPMMLLKQYTGIINSWSIRFCYAGFKQNLPTVYPVGSLVVNQGADGSGTNMKRSNKYIVKPVDEIDPDLFCEPNSEDPQIQFAFMRFYNTSLYRSTINWFKLKRYTLGI